MRQRGYWAAILTAASFIAMFGGALRLGAEVVARLLPADAADLITPRNIGTVILTAITVVVEMVLLYRWPWYREQMRLDRDGIRVLYGLPPSASSPPIGRTIRRFARWFGLLVFPYVVVGIVLPGPAAAGCAVVAGVVLRVVAGVVAAV